MKKTPTKIIQVLILKLQKLIKKIHNILKYNKRRLYKEDYIKNLMKK